MRRIFILLICLFLLSSPFLSPAASADNGGTTVYVTQTGYAYHRSGCYHLKSRIPMTLREAVESGYSPCKDCKPPTPDFSASVATAPTRSSSGNSDSRYSIRASSSRLQPVFDWFNALPRPLFLLSVFLFAACCVFASWLSLSLFIWLLSVLYGWLCRFSSWIRRR